MVDLFLTIALIAVNLFQMKIPIKHLYQRLTARMQTNPRKYLLGLSAICIGFILFINSQQFTTIEYPIDIQAISKKEQQASDLALNWETTTVRKGDNLSTIFARFNLTKKELHNILATKTDKISKQYLANLQPGQILKLSLGNSNQHNAATKNNLIALQLIVSPNKAVHIHRYDDAYQVHYEEQPLETKLVYGTALIKDSLFSCATKAGIDQKLIMQLADIFAWDIDFALDIRPQDSFKILYEEQHLEAEKIATGDIITAEFTNKGKTYRAVRYTDKYGHTRSFTPEGYSMQKAFIRTPVKFTRISSHFSLGRKHPVLHKIRAHKGVDYAAPRGTPVKAAGNGKVIFLGRKGGYGNAIILKHGQKYTTLYAHLSNFRKALKNGSWVKQGQVIGYVGSTGLASGPHLHYEFRINGVHHNPVTVKLPKASPIAKQEKEKFILHAKQSITQLNTHRESYLAKLDQPNTNNKQG